MEFSFQNRLLKRIFYLYVRLIVQQTANHYSLMLAYQVELTFSILYRLIQNLHSEYLTSFLI